MDCRHYITDLPERKSGQHLQREERGAIQAQKRKSEVEHEIDTGTFIPPASIKIKDFLIDFVDMYGKRKWGLSMYTPTRD